MKGLLVKDFSLMKMQKNFFITILGIAAFMTVFLKNISFPMGFLPMVISLFTLSTISYDEFDNGNAFFVYISHYTKNVCNRKILSGNDSRLCCLGSRHSVGRYSRLDSAGDFLAYAFSCCLVRISFDVLTAGSHDSSTVKIWQ